MMLTLLLYAYVTGQRSSRRIEAACRTDAAYRVICGDVVPDHATIARFLVNHEHAIEDVFVAVLRLCAAAGLVSVGMVAIDGTKIGSDAALDRNRSAEWIRREVATILSRARETDACENDQPGLLAVDQLPEQLSSATGRLARLEEALALIEAQDAAAAAKAQARAANARDEAAAGRKLRGRKPKDPHAALARAEADETAVRVKARRQTAGHASDAELAEALEADPNVQAAAQATATARVAAQAATPTTRANITDPQSRIMKTATGWVQGYNAQAAVNEHQIVLACHVSHNANDVGLFQPMIDATHQMLQRAGVSDQIGLVLADAGYWSEDNATAHGPDRLIATTKDWKQRRAARELGTTHGDPPVDASPLEAMEHRLRTSEGADAYAKRSHTVEPVFASKANHDYRRFRRRGLGPAQSEWALIATAHNLGKLHRIT
jgi:hypothetical protein